jgi:hypothetical protein
MVIPSITSQTTKTLDGRNKIVLQPLDQQPAPGTNNYYPAITSISTEPRPDGSEKVFVETFLIDAVSAPNKMRWRVSYDNPADFDRRVQDSKNHPLVLFQTPHPTKDGEMIFDHPVAPITSLEAAADPLRATIEFQKKYTIGYARHFKKIKDGVWHAVYEIVNPKAKKFFKNAKEKGLKLFTSPHIVRPTAENDRTNIKEWALIHNAIVSNPAHNEAIASIKKIASVVARKAVDFSSLFASMDTPDDDYGLMNADELLQMYEDQLTSHDNNEAPILHMAESASANNATTQQTTTTSPPNQSTITTEYPGQTQKEAITETKSINQLPQQELKQDTEVPTTNNNQPASELDSLKQQIEALNKQNQDLQQRYAQDTRKAGIEKLFAPIAAQLYADPKTGILDEKAYNTEVNRLMKSNHNFDEIQELIQARYVIAQYQSQKGSVKPERASLTSQVDETASIPYTKMHTNDNATVFNNTESLGLSVLKRLQGAKLE